MRNRIVLLDLEECLIDSWFDQNTLHYNIEKIKESGILNPDPSMGVNTVTVGIMSWAICGHEDVQVFNSKLRGPLEEALGVEFDKFLPLSMEEYASDMLHCRNLRLSTDDLYDVFRKEEVLFSLARRFGRFECKEIVLIDDAVDHNLMVTIPYSFEPGKKKQVARMTTLRFINIDTAPNTWQFSKREGR